jgi:mannose-6-phosphate isomerase
MYPLKMTTAFKDYLWGGTRLRDEYGKKTDMTPIAESWEISCHPDGPSTVANGGLAGKTLAALLTEHPDWMGTHAKDEEFPLLIKLIDAKDRLSVQVHPDDTYARREENQQGKNEMWYVVDAEPGAELILGLTRPADRDELRQRIADNTLLEIANRVPVKAGDCFSIPAGLLHAIGAGVLVAEIQQNSNVTYRVYDYDRRGPDGQPRPLHVERALDVIDPSLQAAKAGEGIGLSQPLTGWDYFYTCRIQFLEQTKIKQICDEESCQCLLVTRGEFELICPDELVTLRAGESAFLPAGMGAYYLSGEGEILVTTI